MGIYYVFGVPFGNELYHHGILGQKWGVRRFQNPDGTLTEAGKKRYSKEGAKEVSSHLSKSSSDLSNGYGAYAKLATTNETTYSELKRASNRLRAYADNLFNKEMEYDSISGIYDKDDSIRTKFENDARSRFKDVIEDARIKGADEYDIDEFIRDVAYDNYIMSDHPMRIKAIKLDREVKSASKKLKDEVENYSSIFLGAYGNLPAKSIRTGEESTVKDLFSDLLYQTAINDSYQNYWKNK